MERLYEGDLVVPDMRGHLDFQPADAPAAQQDQPPGRSGEACQHGQTLQPGDRRAGGFLGGRDAPGPFRDVPGEVREDADVQQGQVQPPLPAQRVDLAAQSLIVGGPGANGQYRHLNRDARRSLHSVPFRPQWLLAPGAIILPGGGQGLNSDQRAPRGMPGGSSTAGGRGRIAP